MQIRDSKSFFNKRFFTRREMECKQIKNLRKRKMSDDTLHNGGILLSKQDERRMETKDGNRAYLDNTVMPQSYR